MYIMKQKISITISEKVLRDIDSLIDNIVIRNRSQAIEFFIKNTLKDSKIAVILAGESRKPTPGKIRHRYSLKINNMTLIERNIRKLGESGFRTIYIVADHLTLTNIFKIVGDGSDYNLKIEFIDDHLEEGTGSAIKLLKGKIKNTFLVAYSDILLENVNLVNLWQQHMQDRVVVTLLVGGYEMQSGKLVSTDNTLCGNVKLDGNKVVSFIEKPNKKKMDSLIFSRGIYVSDPEVFSYPGKELEYNIFPILSSRKLMGGQMTSQPHLHIHNHEDLERVRKLVQLM